MRKKPGRKFEELVARLERALAPRGAVVASPDYVRDRVTGRKREVDASIRFDHAGEPVLITVECRDHRKGRQDDRWIEQLITKREKIGAARTVAVSSSGFSRSAIQTARAYGVELRRIDEITDDEIAQEWTSSLEFSFIVTDYRVLGINLVDVGGNNIGSVELQPDVLEKVHADRLNSKFIFHAEGEESALSVSDVIQFAGEPRELTDDGIPLKSVATLRMERKEYYISCREGVRRYLSRVDALVEFRKRRVPGPIHRVQAYMSDNTTLIQAVHAVGDDGPTRYTIEVDVRNGPPPTTTADKKQP